MRIEPEWRSSVYAYLAEHSGIWIPPDGGALNLSAEEAVQVGAMQVQPVPKKAGRMPRRPPAEAHGTAVRPTFQHY